MDSDSDFVFLKNCLEEFDYPSVCTFNAQQFAEVFHSSNRIFLVTWILKKILPECEQIIETAENKEETLAQLVLSMGFCLPNKATDFLQSKLPLDEQLAIFRLIFQHLKDITKEIDTNIQPVSIDEIFDLKNNNLNLFPCYGEIKVMSDEEIQKQISKIKQEIEECKISGEESQITNINMKSLKDLNELKEHLLNLQPSIIKCLIDEETPKNNAKLKTPPETKDLVEECASNMKIISQVKIIGLKIFKLSTIFYSISPI